MIAKSVYKKYAVFVGEQMATGRRMALTVVGYPFNQGPGCRVGGDSTVWVAKLCVRQS